MLSLLTSRFKSAKLRKLEDIPAALVAGATETVVHALDEITPAEESKLLETVGWVSAAMGALALGLFVGRELRQRYKFNRRTPYDFYAHSGDELHDMEFGVGI